MILVDKDDIQRLREFRDETHVHPFARFPEGSQRDRLRKAGLIECYNPAVKATGRLKPWRLTPAGYEALKQ